MIKFLQTKNNNFKGFRFFAKSMLTIVRKVILDISVQKETKFIQYQSAKNLEFACKPEVEFLHMRINLHFAWHLKDTVLAVARKISHRNGV